MDQGNQLDSFIQWLDLLTEDEDSYSDKLYSSASSSDFDSAAEPAGDSSIIAIITEIEHAESTLDSHDSHDHSESDDHSSALNAGSGGSGGTKTEATPAELADYLINGFWQDVGDIARSWSQSNVTFSISNEFSASNQQGFREGFQTWQDVANISFTEVSSGADITIVEGDDGSAWSASSVYSNGDIASNTISIDVNTFSWSNLHNIGGYGLSSVIHEIGHSLGLGHSGNYNGSATYDTDAIWSNDTRQFTIMSYFSADHSGADHFGSSSWQYASTPLLFDILAMQTIYGANYSTRSGDTVYGFNSTAGLDQFDFSITDEPVIAIWDGGGTDTIDLSGYSVSQVLSLEEGVFSDIGGMTGNVVIAYNAVIENAIGGSGSDTIYGNSAQNIILGGAGDDIIFGSVGDDSLNGESGSDTVNYSYTVDSFSFNFIDNVTVALNHITEGFTDTIENIEDFIFSGISYTFSSLQELYGANTVPTVSSPSEIYLSFNEVILASTVISASDAQSDAIFYEVWDGGSATTSGYFQLDGLRLNTGQSIMLTAEEFSRLEIVGGSVNSVENLWVRVSDHELTSTWDSIKLFSQDAGSGGVNTEPTIALSDLSLAINETVLASTYVNVVDAEGDALTIEVWDGNSISDSGYFQLDGVQLNAGQAISLTQSEFDRLEIVGGDTVGKDTLWIRATDGVLTKSWESFILTTQTSSVSGGGNTLPTVSVSDFSLLIDETELASNIISAVDAEGDTLSYDVWDGGKALSSGYFELDGVRLDHGKSISLTEAEFARLNIVGGDSGYSDNMWVRVSDGSLTTDWNKFILTTLETGGGAVNTAPVVSANNATLAIDEVIAASTIIAATDAEGDSLSYEVWDGGKALSSAYFELDGVRLDHGISISLTEAEFGRLNIVGGDSIGMEAMWVRVSDQGFTTSWDQFEIRTEDNGSSGGGNTAPSTTADNFSLGVGHNVLASAFITINDNEGDIITYEVWDGDSSINSAHFELDGIRLAAGSSVALTDAEFSRLRIIGASSNKNESFWVRVSDAEFTSKWDAFTVTTNSSLSIELEDPLLIENILETDDQLDQIIYSDTSNTLESTQAAFSEDVLFNAIVNEPINELDTVNLSTV